MAILIKHSSGYFYKEKLESESDRLLHTDAAVIYSNFNYINTLFILLIVNTVVSSLVVY